MANALKAARLRYLGEASTQLHTASPAISAHLQTVRQTILRENNENTTIQPSAERVCAACGNILLPGWSCESVTKASVKRTRQDRLAAAESGRKILKLRCNKCSAITTVESKRLSRKKRAGWTRTRTEVHVAPAAREGADERTGKLNAQDMEKRTQKGSAARRGQRGKKESLLAMLDRQKKAEESAGAGFGFDLMDLMKR